jgi:hypothetical protein
MTSGFDAERVAAARARYRPTQITTLFVAEAPPASGNFFYFGNTQMTREMRRAIDPSITDDMAFLESFKARGWYLDDLILTPLGKVTPLDRQDAHWRAKDGLQDRIAEYRPRAIVALLHSIKPVVQAAAGRDIHAVKFPGNGEQLEFRREMAAILPWLPTLT